MRNFLKLILYFAALNVISKAEVLNYTCYSDSCTFQNFSVEEFNKILTENKRVSILNGFDGEKWYISNVKKITLKGTPVNKLSEIKFETHSNLETFEGINLGLKSIKSEDFKNVNRLALLKLSYNDITQLEEKLFVNLKRIQEIDLSHNKIFLIADETFDGSGTDLTKINLSFNQIKVLTENFLLAEWTISRYESYKIVDINLSHNLISECKAGDRNQSTSVLFNLNLNFNDLKEFKLENIKIKQFSMSNNEFESFDGNYEWIDISNNKLKKLEIGADCTSMNASNNQLSEIYLKSSILTYLDISENNLNASKNIHQFFKTLKQIKNLNLSKNSFEDFNLDDFAEMEGLEEIWLSNNELKEIPHGLFENHENLKILNLSQNLIADLDFHALSSLDSLETLDLSGNSLTTLNKYEDFRNILPSLRNIGLEDNHWNCAYLSKLNIILRTQGIRIMEPQNYTKNANDNHKGGIKCEINSKTEADIIYSKIFAPSSTFNDQKLYIDQKFKELLEKINLKMDQNKLDNEKMILTQKVQQKPIESFSPLKSAEEKASGISSVEFFLGILLAITLTVLIMQQVKNYKKRHTFRMPQISGRQTPNTIVTFDSQSVL